MSEAAPACCCRLQDVDSLCSGCGLSLFDVDGRHISRLEVSTLLWHLLWYVTQPSSQNRRPGHMWWCLVQFTLITRSLRLTPPPPPPLVATETAAQCLTLNAEFTRQTEDVLYVSPHETVIKITCFVNGVW